MSAQTRRALVIGMATYASDLENLPSGVADAREVEKLLRLNVDGSDNFEVTVHLSDDFEQLSTERLMQIVDTWFAAGSLRDGVIYFSGHARNTSYGLYLAGSETDGNLNAGFPFDSLLHRANQENFGSLTIILDCCDAGAAGGVTLDTRFDALLLRKNVAIIAATREQEDAWSGDPTSHFTEQLIGALSNEAISALGPVDVFRAFHAVREVLLTIGQQTPVLKAHISQDVILRA